MGTGTGPATGTSTVRNKLYGISIMAEEGHLAAAASHNPQPPAAESPSRPVKGILKKGKSEPKKPKFQEPKFQEPRYRQ